MLSPVAYGRCKMSLRLFFCHVTSSSEDIENILSAMNSSIDVLCICETFLSMDSCLPSYIFPGYQVISKIRNRMRQGGLSFLLKNGIKFEERDDLCLWIEGKVEVFSVEIVFVEKKKDSNLFGL